MCQRDGDHGDSGGYTGLMGIVLVASVEAQLYST